MNGTLRYDDFFESYGVELLPNGGLLLERVMVPEGAIVLAKLGKGGPARYAVWLELKNGTTVDGDYFTGTDALGKAWARLEVRRAGY